MIFFLERWNRKVEYGMIRGQIAVITKNKKLIFEKLSSGLLVSPKRIRVA